MQGNIPCPFLVSFWVLPWFCLVLTPTNELIINK